MDKEWVEDEMEWEWVTEETHNKFNLLDRPLPHPNMARDRGCDKLCDC